MVGLAGLLLRQPISGVDREVSFSYQNRNLTLDLQDQHLLEDRYAGTFDLMNDEVIIATSGKSVWDFISTCSHEMYHAEQHLNEIGSVDEHENMVNYDLPWNWRPKCLDLLKYRTP